MENKKLLAGAVVALSAVSLAPVAHAAPSDTIAVDAVIQAAASIVGTTNLDFGTLGSTGGTYVVEPVGGATYTALGGSPQPGGFDLTGAGGATVLVTASSPVTLTNGSLVTMTADNFQIATNAGGNPATLTLTAGGSLLDVPIGGTLNVNASQATGTYTGAMTLTVAYN